MKRKKENKTRGLYDYKYYNHKKYIKKIIIIINY